jgi:hypothetical protein
VNLFEVPGIFARIEDISDDGKMLINQGSDHTTMVVLEGQSPPKVLDSRFAWTTSVDISADGKTLLCDDWGYEGSDPLYEENTVYLRKLDGSQPLRIGTGKALALSPDGKWALALQTTGQQQLILLPISSGTPRTLPNPDTSTTLGDNIYLRTFLRETRQVSIPN